MEFPHLWSHWMGRLIEGAAGWHLDREAREGSQVIAIALRSREGFVLHHGELYLLAAEEIGHLLPGRILSRGECRSLFGADGQAQASRRLEPQTFVSATLVPEGASGLARVEARTRDGAVRTWTFAAIATAEDLVARLEDRRVVSGAPE